MQRFFFLAASFAFVACSQQESAEGPAANADVIDPNGETRLVDNPPVYESVPLPDGLEWMTNEEDPTFASPNAKPGGTFHTYITSFPLTLRMYGPDSNSGDFVAIKRSIHLALLALHPNTLRFIPSLATHWAIGPDGRRVYYRLDPGARWSDGVPVMADDYVFSRQFRLSDSIVDPYGKNYFTNVITDIAKHDDYTISVELNTAKPGDELLYQTNMSPTPRHFHRLDENWVQDYNWRVPPNTGPYQISAVEKGRYIEFSRQEDWWGNDLKYYRNRFNVDTIRIDIIRDENVAFEYFLRGELDSFDFTQVAPSRWHEKARGEPFDKGYVHKIQFYNDVPRESRGLWLNMDDPILADKNVRYGLAHAINMEQVLSTLFRGDYERLRMHYEGFYWGYSHPDIQARGFDLAKADEYLDTAGWTERGADGIRMKDGRRLSLRVTYGTQEHSPWLILLREEARKAGIELALQLLDPSAWGTQVGQKNFQIVFLAFGTGLTPSFWQAYHSDNAHVPQTNNITNTDDAELDALIDEYESASDLETRIRLSHEIQAIIHDIGAFIPAYKRTYVRETYWRWLQMPDSRATRISDAVFDPISLGLIWIDEDIKADTLAARREGRTFEPVSIVDTTWKVD